MMCKVLIFSCISAVVLVTAAYGATLASPEKVELLNSLIKDLKLLGKSKHETDLKFYTPNVNQECSQTILECYQSEISMLGKEFASEDAFTLQNIIKNLQKLKDLTPLTRGNCMACEANSEKTFPEFHEALLNLLRSMQK